MNDLAAERSRPESLYTAVLGTRGAELTPVQPLVSIKDGYDDQTRTVGRLQGVGCTNITIGAAWGMAMLSKSEPFAEAANPSSNLEKIMVIVTDGDNTKSRFHGDCREGTPESAKIDARTTLACKEARNAGIRVITIRLIEGNAALLKECATRETNPKDPFYRGGKPLYHDVRDPKDLKGAFDEIADTILATRLTQ